MSKSDIEYDFDLMGFGLCAAMASLQEPTNLKLAFWADKTPQGADFWAPAIFNNAHTPETLTALQEMITQACLRAALKKRILGKARLVLIGGLTIVAVVSSYFTALTLALIGAA